jgi:tRNA 2-thiouridine synthesizing protein B
MAMLHIVNKSPFERNALDSCMRLATAGAAVLFIEDGVIGALKNTANSHKVSDAMSNLKFYVLGPDLKARGMSEDRLIDGVSVVDYDGFVDLVTGHDRVQSWL